MNMQSFWSRVGRSSVFSRVAVLLAALALCGLCSCDKHRDAAAEEQARKDQIFDAASRGNMEKLTELLKVNPDLPVTKNTDGLTPLHWAAIGGRKDVAEWLLANNAMVNEKDNLGRTPSYYAAFYDHKDVAELLRQHGGQPLP
jgi:ankyrin repeat protein